MMNEREKSDPSIVAAKLANKSGGSDTESEEPRGGAKGNTPEPHTHRTLSRDSVSPGLWLLLSNPRESKIAPILAQPEVDRISQDRGQQ